MGAPPDPVEVLSNELARGLHMLTKPNRALEERRARERGTTMKPATIGAPICDSCDGPAHCVGEMEDEPGVSHGLAFSCDECCGHDGEHGKCWRIAVLTAPLAAIRAEAQRLYDLAETGEDVTFLRFLIETCDGKPMPPEVPTPSEATP